jgi:DNA-binding sugar fermentation-stimulating protein
MQLRMRRSKHSTQLLLQLAVLLPRLSRFAFTVLSHKKTVTNMCTQNGKIKNKVLKLTAEVLGIQIDAAQGGSGSGLAAEQAKLANNIKLDTAAAGQASTAVAFTATT